MPRPEITFAIVANLGDTCVPTILTAGRHPYPSAAGLGFFRRHAKCVVTGVAKLKPLSWQG